MSDKLKPCSVDQQPLYGCCQCYEEYSFPADDLRVHDGQCWCSGCWDCNCDDVKPEWRSLKKFEPIRTRAADPAKDAMREALEKVESECVVLIQGEEDFYACIICGAATELDDDENIIELKHPEDCLVSRARAALALDKEQNDAKP